jgi:excisionase family DNA binding protein
MLTKMIQKNPNMPHTGPTSDDVVLTTRAAATLLGVSVSTAQHWMESGVVASWKTPGGHRRAYRSTVIELIEAQRGRHNPEAETLVDEDRAPAPLISSAQTFPLPEDEAARLQAVERSGLMDGIGDPAFDRLTWLARELIDSSISLLTVLNADTQYFMSRQGIESSRTPRDWAFCSHAILQDDIFVVEDAKADLRFQDNPLVTAAPFIRFYAGYPLRDPDGYRLGTLCVIDREPRKLRSKESRALRELAAIAEDLIKLRRLEAQTG